MTAGRDLPCAVEFRPALPGDEALLALVGQATFLDAYAGVLPAEDIALHCAKAHAVSVYATWLGDGSSRMWLAVAVPGGAPVGYVVLTRPELPLAEVRATDLEVKRIYLLRGWQGAGLGRRLMEQALVEARARGSRRLLLCVYSLNRPALAFYERLGFVKVGTREFSVGRHTYHDWVLARPVEPTASVNGSGGV